VFNRHGQKIIGFHHERRAFSFEIKLKNMLCAPELSSIQKLVRKFVTAWLFFGVGIVRDMCCEMLITKHEQKCKIITNNIHGNLASIAPRLNVSNEQICTAK
jgi:hypothetical protein